MYYSIFLFFLGLVFIFSFALGIFTILINPKSKNHQLWFLTNVGVTMWSSCLFIVIFFKLLSPLGITLTRILHIGSLLLIIFFFHFILSFSFKLKQYKIWLISGYLIAVFLSLLILITDWVIKGVMPVMKFEVWLEPGKLFLLLVLYFIIYGYMSIYLLFKEYFNSEGLKKWQSYYILLAGIFGLGGGLIIFFANLFNVYPFGIFFIFLYPLFITYGILLKKS